MNCHSATLTGLIHRSTPNDPFLDAKLRNRKHTRSLIEMFRFQHEMPSLLLCVAQAERIKFHLDMVQLSGYILLQSLSWIPIVAAAAMVAIQNSDTGNDAWQRLASKMGRLSQCNVVMMLSSNGSSGDK